MRSESPHIGFFPALPLAKNLELGEWIAGTPPPEAPWVPGRFRELSETLIQSFEKRNFKGGALLWHRDRGFDGSLPPDDDIAAIRAAVTFAVLDANDRLGDDLNKGRYIATAENADLFLQPIDEDEGGITHRRGGVLKGTIVGGLKIGGEPPPLPDAVEPISGTVPASRKLAAAVFASVRSDRGDGPAVATAAEWHRTALANPRAVTMQQRLIALKTGFEVLLRTSSSKACAQRLRALFARTTRKHRDLLPWIGLLWSPDEKTNLWRWFWHRDGNRQIERRTEIEDWFMTLAEARNGVIHTGRLTTREYTAPSERPLSRYTGHLLLIGERVLREAIKATLGPQVLLCGALARRAWAKAVFGQYVAELRKRMQSAEQHAPTTANVAPAEDRSPPLAGILGFLGCASANYVTLSKAPGGSGPTLEIAQEMADRLAGKWCAEVPGKSILISRAEYEALKQAGAEDELPNYWDPCE